MAARSSRPSSRTSPNVPGNAALAFASGQATTPTEERRQALPQADTSIADYVWLPIRFEGDMPLIDWTTSGGSRTLNDGCKLSSVCVSPANENHVKELRRPQ